MHDKLSENIVALSAADKEIVNTNHLQQLETWARLLDEVGANLHLITSLNNSEQQYTQYRQRFEQGVLGAISKLNVANDPGTYQNLKNQIANYSNDFNQLVDMKMKILAIDNDLTNLAAIKRANSEAKRRSEELEKSFSDYTQKQAEQSTRTLAKHFEARLKDLKRKDNKLTSPEFWAKRRDQWLLALTITIVVLAILYFIIIYMHWFVGFEWQILAIKAALVAILYLQYHFATKNYHIYADLVAKYEHRAVISKTMTDFSAVAYEDEILREAVLSNSSKTLFAEIESGHLKSADKEANVFENVINQIPKS